MRPPWWRISTEIWLWYACGIPHITARWWWNWTEIWIWWVCGIPSKKLGDDIIIEMPTCLLCRYTFKSEGILVWWNDGSPICEEHGWLCQSQFCLQEVFISEPSCKVISIKLSCKGIWPKCKCWCLEELSLSGNNNLEWLLVLFDYALWLIQGTSSIFQPIQFKTWSNQN